MAFTDRSCMRTRPALEQLEGRAVPAMVVSQLIGTQLIVTGTQGPDRIRVDLDTSSNQVLVRSYGQEVGRYSSGAISEVIINGQAGNDIIAVSPSIPFSTVIAGGEGNDILQAGTGDAMVTGDGGVINRVMGGNGTNILISGSGNDVLGAGQATTISWCQDLPQAPRGCSGIPIKTPLRAPRAISLVSLAPNLLRI